MRASASSFFNLSIPSVADFAFLSYLPPMLCHRMESLPWDSVEISAMVPQLHTTPCPQSLGRTLLLKYVSIEEI